MFDKSFSSMQQKMSMTSVGVTRRQVILDELKVKSGQTIIDVGCGGGQFVEELALRVGLEGLAIGVEPSEAQLSTAEASCNYLQNTKFLSCSADKIDLDSSSCDAVTFTQTLEYIDDVDPAIRESTRLSKSGSKFVNVSTLWDYFGFHGPKKNLNSKMHDVIRGQKHPMLPTQLNGILENFGYKNIRTNDISFYITTREEYSFPKFHELNMVRAELQNGISEDEVKKWQDQLNQAEQDGTFAFTSFAILTSTYWLLF